MQMQKTKIIQFPVTKNEDSVAAGFDICRERETQQLVD